MYLIPSRKLIYLAQPRTASTSIAGWLTRNELGHQVSGNPSWPSSWGDHHGVDLIQLQELQDRGWKAFCFVRNHWDYATSFYYEHVGTLGFSFGRFMDPDNKDGFFGMTWHRPQGPWEHSKKRLFWLLPRLSDYVLRFEHLPTNLVPMLGDGYRSLIMELPNVNQSKRAPMSELWTEELVRLVQSKYRPEIEEYGYRYYGQWVPLEGE